MTNLIERSALWACSVGIAVFFIAPSLFAFVLKIKLLLAASLLKP
jgi:uncharacterized membrane protein YqgA involved in biofilm formation